MSGARQELGEILRHDSPQREAALEAFLDLAIHRQGGELALPQRDQIPGVFGQIGRQLGRGVEGRLLGFRHIYCLW